jgi:hypothetical protein
MPDNREITTTCTLYNESVASLEAVLKDEKYNETLRKCGKAVLEAAKRLKIRLDQQTEREVNLFLPRITRINSILNETKAWVTEPATFPSKGFGRLIGQAYELADHVKTTAGEKLAIAIMILGAVLVLAALVALTVVAFPAILPLVAAITAVIVKSVATFLAGLGISASVSTAIGTGVGVAADFLLSVASTAVSVTPLITSGLFAKKRIYGLPIELDNFGSAIGKENAKIEKANPGNAVKNGKGKEHEQQPPPLPLPFPEV